MSSQPPRLYRSVYRRGEAMGYEQGCADTKQRIIKLLESLKFDQSDSAWQSRDWSQVELEQTINQVLDEAIELIKGENK